MRPSPGRWLPAFAAVVGVLLTAVAVRAAPAPVAAAPAVPVHEVRLSLAVPVGAAFEFVEISMFALDDGASPLEDRIAEGRAAMLARFPGAIELEPAEVSAQFQIFGIRWPQPFATWLYNPEGGPASMPAETALEAIKAGAGGWTNAGGTGWHFDFLATTTTPTGCNGIPESIPRDGLNVVGWGHIAGGYLGYSCWWSGPSFVDGTPYFEMTEFDLIFQPEFSYTGASLQALALHEFGHALGLDHTEAPCPGQVMCEGRDAMTFSTPREDDINGLIALYGYAPTPTATLPTPSATATPPATAPPRPYRAVLPVLARD